MRVYLDFESHYDPAGEYTLGKMPTWQYIRDERWQCLGCAVALDDGPAYYVQPDRLPALFARIPWDRAEAVAHNVSFDGSVLYHHYGCRPAHWLDTKLIARYLVSQGRLPPDQTVSLSALAHIVGRRKGDTHAAVQQGGQALAAYGVEDLEIMRALLKKWQAEHDIPALEYRLMDLHARVSCEPVLAMDRDLLQQEVDARKDCEGLYEKLRQDETFARLLRNLGVEPETKVTTKGNTKYAFAKTDGFMSELEAHPSDRVRTLASLKLDAHSSINHTRAKRFLNVGAPLPCPTLYYGTHTGRSSGEDRMNPLNLPRGGTLRRAIRAQPGHKLVIVDSGQIEARVVNYVAGQEDALDRFRQSDAGTAPDAYKQFAGTYLYNVPPSEVTKDQRQVGKAGVLALGFGQGANGFLAYCAGDGIHISPQEAERVVSIYRYAHNRVKAFWYRSLDEILTTRQQALLNGRLLTYPDIYWERDKYGRDQAFFKRPVIFSKGARGYRQPQKLWHGTATENNVQANARDIVLWQTDILAQRWRVVMTTYDEAVFHVPEDAAEDCLKDALDVFKTPPPFAPGLPVIGEGIISDDYGTKP